MNKAVTERDLRLPEFKDIESLDELEFRKDGKIVRKDRWEKAIFKIVSALRLNNHDFELSDIVSEVQRIQQMVGKTRIAWVSASLAEKCERTPKGEEALVYSPSFQNPSKVMVCKFTDGYWMQGSFKVGGVTHWAELPENPYEVLGKAGREM